MTKPTKLPQDWKPTDFDVKYAKERGFTDAEIDDIAEDFATYWLLGMGRNKTHLCWSGSGRSCWATWVRRTNPKSKPETGFVGTTDEAELDEFTRRRRLTEIVNKRKLELRFNVVDITLTTAERVEADRYLQATSKTGLQA